MIYLIKDKGLGRYGIDLDFVVYCGVELFNALKLHQDSKESFEVRIEFEVGVWDEMDNYTYSAQCRMLNFDIRNTILSEDYYGYRRVRHVEKFLTNQCCDVDENSTIRAICKDFSEAFFEKSYFDKRNQFFESIIPLLRSIKHLHKLNDFSKRISAATILKNGYYQTNTEYVINIVEEYLKIPKINSATLNSILVDRLLLADIFDKSSHMQVEGLLTVEAVFAVCDGDYFTSKKELINKSIWQHFIDSFADILIGLIVGIMAWFIASMLSGSSELSQYFLFGAFFTSFYIAMHVKQSKSSSKSMDIQAQDCYLLLHDMCNVHKRCQAEYVNTDLLKYLMYKLEERGVMFNQHIYEIIKRSSLSNF